MRKIGFWVVLCSMSVSVMAQKTPVGIVSIQDTVKSVQVGIISSVATDGGHGVQLSVVSNAVSYGFDGLQLSIINNIIQGMNQGVQLSALLNVSSCMMRGVQVGTFNYADTLNGAQVGLFNVARKHPKGWQIGLINLSYDSIGHKVGLINVNPTTDIDLMLYGGSSTKVNVATRYRNKSTYSIFGVGTHFMGLDSKFSGALFYRLGQYWQLTPKLSISGDIGYYHVETFRKNSNDAPERLYSLQARINADYQLTKRLGVFASVGWGVTRYYNRNETYRNRPLVELGMTLCQPRNRHNTLKAAFGERRDSLVYGDSTMALPGKKHPWWALAEVTGINVGVQLFDRYVTREDFAQTTLRTIRQNFERGMVWDNDYFHMNMFMHPYHGNLYFNAARTNGPAINDIFATTCGGMAIGEMTHRLSRTVLDDRARGFRRFLREAAAAIINPIQGLHRIISGDAWRVKSSHYRYHDFRQIPLDASVSIGWRYLADDGALFRGVHAPFVNLTLAYGTSVDGESHRTPYDFFDIEANIAFGGGQPLVNTLSIVGRLWSTPILDKKDMAGEFGIYQHYNYYNSKTVEDGSELTPYRLSEVAAFGPGFIVSLPKIGALSKMEQRIFVSGIMLGGTKSDYFNVIERDYNMGSGFSVKSKTQLDFGRAARFVLNTKFFRLYTWKGYKKEDLDNGFANIPDLRYLNVQGDRSHASLFVINPLMEMHMAKQWSITLSGAFYVRSTHYDFYDNVKAKTFETKVGVTCRL